MRDAQHLKAVRPALNNAHNGEAHCRDKSIMPALTLSKSRSPSHTMLTDETPGAWTLERPEPEKMQERVLECQLHGTDG